MFSLPHGTTFVVVTNHLCSFICHVKNRHRYVFYFDTMALREGNSKDWSVMCCHWATLIWWLPSHLHWNLLSLFQASAMSDGMCQFPVIIPIFARQCVCLLLPLNYWLSDQIQMQISKWIIVTKLQQASFLRRMQTSQFKSWNAALPSLTNHIHNSPVFMHSGKIWTMQHAKKAIKFELFWIREEESVPKALSSHKEHPVGSSSLFYTSKAPSSLVFTDLNCGNMRERVWKRSSFTYVKASCEEPFRSLKKKVSF